MHELAETLKIFVPAVLVPLCAFIANWIYRGQSDYNLTAASDFLLAYIVFGVAIIATAKDFEPFVKDEALKTVVTEWHVGSTALVSIAWLSVIRYAEPQLSKYYKATRKKIDFPYKAFITSWTVAILFTILEILFFVVNGAR